MDTVGFGLSAPIALDALLKSGDELVVAFIVIGSVYLVSDRRGTAAGVVLALLILASIQLLPEGDNGDLISVGLAATTFVIAAFWLLDINTGRQNMLVGALAGFAVTLLMGLELLGELKSLAVKYSSVLPVWLGFVSAIVNVIGLGGLISKMIYDAPGFPRLTEPMLRKLSASLLIGFSIYCVGSTSGLSWPGDELVIALFAALAWVCTVALSSSRSL